MNLRTGVPHERLTMTKDSPERTKFLKEKAEVKDQIARQPAYIQACLKGKFIID